MIMSKLSRHGVILELVKQGPLPNQDELRRTLAKHGFKVTQATLSRDIHKLGLIKASNGYMLPQLTAEAAPDPELPTLERLMRDFVREVREAQNLLVVKTAVGSAQSVAVAWDAESWPEIVGTVAGDDTILLISPDSKTAHKVALRIKEMLA